MCKDRKNAKNVKSSKEWNFRVVEVKEEIN